MQQQQQHQQQAAAAAGQRAAAAVLESRGLYGKAPATAYATGNCDTPPPHYAVPQCARVRPCRNGGIEWWRVQCVSAVIFAELVGTFFIGLALAVRDYYVFAGLADVGPVVAAAIRASASVGVMLAFLPVFYSGNFNPMYTVIKWCCERRMWYMETLGEYFGRLLGQFLGFLFAAWLVSAVTAAPLSCTLVNPLVGNGYGFLFEFLGSLVLIHVYVLAVARKTSGLTGVLGLGLAEFAIVAAFAPLTGGSFNFFRSLGVALVQGSACSTGLGVYIGSMFAALIVAAVMLYYIFPAKCAPKVEINTVKLTVHDQPMQPVPLKTC